MKSAGGPEMLQALLRELAPIAQVRPFACRRSGFTNWDYNLLLVSINKMHQTDSQYSQLNSAQNADVLQKFTYLFTVVTFRIYLHRVSKLTLKLCLEAQIMLQSVNMNERKIIEHENT